MVDVLARNWWAILIRGIAALIFGILAFVYPVAAGAALVILFGAYALVDGLFAVIAALRAAKAHERWSVLLISGIVGVLAGAVTFFMPLLTALALLYLIAAWAIVTGLLELVAAFQLRRELSGEVWWVLAGIASVAFGVLLAWRPVTGALAVIWLIGAYAIAFGIFLTGLAFRLRAHVQRPAQGAPA